jgi:hypothetical protein
MSDNMSFPSGHSAAFTNATLLYLEYKNLIFGTLVVVLFCCCYGSFRIANTSIYASDVLAALIGMISVLFSI